MNLPKIIKFSSNNNKNIVYNYLKDKNLKLILMTSIFYDYYVIFFIVTSFLKFLTE